MWHGGGGAGGRPRRQRLRGGPGAGTIPVRTADHPACDRAAPPIIRTGVQDELLLTDAALLVRRREGEWREQRIPFNEIRKVVAFKRDCCTVDSVRMLVVTGAGAVEISEEMSGWEEWITALPERLPGALRLEEWFFAVAFPPFAAQPTLLYEAPERAPDA